MTDSQYVEVASAAEIPDKGFRCFRVNKVALVLARFRDEIYAVENLCSHALASFDNGRMRGPRLMCPLHGATFDIRDGEPKGAPATRPVKTFVVKVDGDRVLVDLAGAEPTPGL